MSRQSIQRIKAMLLCMVCLSTLLIQRSKHANALNAMFVETVNTPVFVALTQHPIQSTMRCENSTLLCIKWPLAPRYKTHPHVSAHNFLNIQPIFNPQKVLESWDWYCWCRTRISNAFNDIYLDTVDTKHIHMFLPITFLIFNRFSICKMFWKAETEGFSTIPSILYMLILLIQDKDL